MNVWVYSSVRQRRSHSSSGSRSEECNGVRSPIEGRRQRPVDALMSVIDLEFESSLSDSYTTAAIGGTSSKDATSSTIFMTARHRSSRNLGVMT
mmetsp:Transcript_16787/g.48887  ORF Transcript_16787/g.48887 Transcript_16787/m.48887 type:complete len:94 (+) Transcript_16787:261-542(+)